MKSASPLQEILLLSWFVLVGVAFWGPYGGLTLPVGPLNALYAVFLLICLTALALRLLRQSPTSRKEDTPHRGR